MIVLNARLNLLPKSLVIVCTLLMGSNASRAESMTAAPVVNTAEVGEPILIRVTRVLDEPYREITDDAREASMQRRRLKHRISAELWDDDRHLASAFIGGVTFLPEKTGSNQVSALAMAWFGEYEAGERETDFAFWMKPGNYRVILKGVDSGIEAEPFVVHIIPPSDSDAARLLAVGQRDALALLHVQEHHGEAAVKHFDRLAHEHPDTVQGRYARIALAIRSASEARGAAQAGELELDNGTLGDELQAVTTLFQEGHPLRSRALLELAHVFLRSDQTDRALQVGRQALKESKDGGMRAASSQLLDTITWRRVDATERARP